MKIDLFEKYEQQPPALQAICERYHEFDGLDYNLCEQFLKEVQAIGYTFEYGLDGEPHSLEPINNTMYNAAPAEPVNDKETRARIAKTILQQIGHGALYMIGAKNFIANDSGVSFKIMRNAKNITHITITLNLMDLYDIDFLNCDKNGVKTLESKKGIYYDGLRYQIRNHTNLNTNL